jgi:hypothetical protein
MDWVRTSERSRQCRSVIDVRTHEVAATLRPSFTLGEISHHSSDRLPNGQKVACHLATEVASDSGNCEHLYVFSRIDSAVCVN